MMAIRAPYSTLSSLSFLRLTAKPKPLFPYTLYSRLYASSVNAAAETRYETPNTITQPSNQHHPWTEWVAFVDRLKSQGYFPLSSSAAELEYGEINVLKDPCLNFARDRYDLFSSFSKGDIQSMLEGGCPKIQRKVVNSAKRLRVYVGLEEKSVCDICSLQGSCDRAYVILGESEGGARMVDLMRLLLSYALDPVLISGAASAPSIKQAESASRRVLSLLINLTEASTGSAPPKSSEKLGHKKEQNVHRMNPSVSQDVEMRKWDWNCPKCGFLNFSRNTQCRKCNEENPKGGSVDVEMKKGGWKCHQCGFTNYSRNSKCRKCLEQNPKGIGVDVEMKKGDWKCLQCGFINFSRNSQCRKCEEENPKGGSVDVEMKKGDWKCLQCGVVNFASRRNCFRCNDPRPPRALNPGEWECSKCDFLNFRRNVTCLKCGSAPCNKEGSVAGVTR